MRSRLYSWFELETRTRTLLAELVQGWRAGGGPRRFVGAVCFRFSESRFSENQDSEISLLSGESAV